MKWSLELDEEHITIILRALDFYERTLGLGQLEEIEYHWRAKADLKDEAFESKSNAIYNMTRAMKAIGWNLEANESRGIRSDSVPEEFRTAYDITQVMRKALNDHRIACAEESGDKEVAKRLRFSVSNDLYWATNPKVSPIIIREISDDDKEAP